MVKHVKPNIHLYNLQYNLESNNFIATWYSVLDLDPSTLLILVSDKYFEGIGNKLQTDVDNFDLFKEFDIVYIYHLKWSTNP